MRLPRPASHLTATAVRSGEYDPTGTSPSRHRCPQPDPLQSQTRLMVLLTIFSKLPRCPLTHDKLPTFPNYWRCPLNHDNTREWQGGGRECEGQVAKWRLPCIRDSVVSNSTRQSKLVHQPDSRLLYRHLNIFGAGWQTLISLYWLLEERREQGAAFLLAEHYVDQ